ncbi:chromo domain-containing protein, partial [Escherichia coli]|nr:chromo domain-containing protein [Escherichia coli]
MNVHPVFHVSKLSPYAPSSIPGRHPPEPPPIKVGTDEEYEVAEIVDSRLFRGHLQYKVKWVGYDDSHTGWEPVDNVAH